MKKIRDGAKLVKLSSVMEKGSAAARWGYFFYRVEFPCGFAVQDTILYCGIRSKRQARAWAMGSAREAHARMKRRCAEGCP